MRHLIVRLRRLAGRLYELCHCSARTIEERLPGYIAELRQIANELEEGLNRNRSEQDGGKTK